MQRSLSVALVVGLVGLSAGVAAAQGPGRGMGRMGGGMSSAMLLRQEAVQQELALTTAQVGEVGKLPEAAPPGGGNPRDMTDDQRRAWMEERMKTQAEEEKKVAAILDAKQAARLKQIRIQALGGRALMDEAVVKELGVTEDQIGKAREAMMEVMQAGQGGGGNPGEMRQKLLDKMNAILTAEQKTKFEALKGPAFDVSKLQLRGPGGGPGGGRRGGAGT
ncbi:MAG: hypothetical protein KGQ61_12525 [Planctomycetes bacterium]|nr:hypothetical protein [Planctomycetota bacterium]